MNNTIGTQPRSPLRGYLEGYYGKLLSWNERGDLLRTLSSLHLSTYCYAPKEDEQHRLRWREPYSSDWRISFARFCTLASEQNISIVAGIAPGLDFNFDQKGNESDFDHLHNKASTFLVDGAHEILILWDDIEQDCFIDRDGLTEGTAHARVINQLSNALGRPLWTVPRVYASEIEDQNNYLEDFFTELLPQHTVLLCGAAIVTRRIGNSDLVKLSCTTANNESTGNESNGTIGINDTLKHRTVAWDNFYANDYCPRRLFLGPWTGREQVNDYLINPTGLPNTDKLLLDIAASTHTSNNTYADWTDALKRHCVPAEFLAIAPYFSQPFFGDRSVTGDMQDIDYIEPTAQIEEAIEYCLWKWKSPLAREWYPFIFGLKHDLALSQGTLPRDRVLKTQPVMLANRLLE